MDGFTYQNIFETKGIEYIVVIGFLLTLIPFWIALNKRIKKAENKIKVPGFQILNSLKIHPGIFYSPNHTWSYLEKSGLAKIGITNLLTHSLGEFKVTQLKMRGEKIQKGDLMAEIHQNGKFLKLFSPVSGEVTDTNSVLLNNPATAKEDSSAEVWMYKIKPHQWRAEMLSCYLADEAFHWSKKEMERFKVFLSTWTEKNNTHFMGSVLQDGGEVAEKALSHLPVEAWEDFQRNFLNVPH